MDNDTPEAPEPIDLDKPQWDRGLRVDRTGEPIRPGYRYDEDEGILYGADDRRRCSAKARNSPAGICHTLPVRRQIRCRMHGGTSPKAKERAQREIAEEKVAALLSSYDVGPVQDPLTALKAMAGEVIAWKDMLRDKVEELQDLSVRTEYGEQAKAVAQLFERAMDRAGDFLFKIARLNIDERLAAVTEAQAKRIEDAFFDALDDVDIPVTDMETREKVSTSFARHLSVVPA